MAILSSTEQTYINHAAQEAAKSTLQSMHGCIAVANGKIVGRGHNTDRTQSHDGFICNTCSCHAEVAAMRNVFHSCGSNTYGKPGNQIKGRREQ